jgi:hypothetical protein
MVRNAIGIEKVEDSMTQFLLDVMAGNAGAAISTIYQLGAGSGAALPTTLVRDLEICFERWLLLVN